MSNDSAPPTGEQVEALLRRHLGTRGRELHVAVRQEGVVLRGHACTFYVKQLAQHIAMEVAGLRILANEIEVRPPQTEDDTVTR
jgi:osmotically-inducible protein OsmY